MGQKVSAAVILVASVVLALRIGTLLYFDRGIPENLLVPAGKIFALKDKSFKFAVMSDTGSFNTSMERIVKHIRKTTDAKFILHLGDLVKYNNRTHFNWIAQELNGKLKGMPLYMISGNHEMSNGNKNLQVYEDVFGSPYYWFSYGDVLFIALDTSLHIIDDEQLEWLQGMLRKIRPQFRRCVVYTHIPPVNPRNDEKELDEVQRDKLAEILRGQKIDLMIAGHVHYFSVSQWAGITLVTVPSSGQEPRNNSGMLGYLVVNVPEKDAVTFEEHPVKTAVDRENVDVFMSATLTKKETGWLAMLALALGIVGYFAYGTRKNLRIGEDSKV